MNSTQIIKNKLLTEGFVDNWEMTDQHITLRLGSVINRLRKAGWNIITDMVSPNHCIYRLQNKP